MRRLIPAAVILILTVAVCIYGHFYIKKACKSTLMDIDDFRNQKISAEELESRWHDREKNMAVFVNNGLLDKITVYIGRLTVAFNEDSFADVDVICKDIGSVLKLIKEQQSFTGQSFY